MGATEDTTLYNGGVNHAEFLECILQVWTGMRPQSLRKMTELTQGA